MDRRECATVRCSASVRVSEETMTRMSRFALLAAAAVGLVAPLSAVQAQGKPTVAIIQFNNNAFGPGARDYDGLAKGIADFLVTEMSGSENVRVIERGQVQKLVDEQKLVTGGQVDKETAIKVGKLLGAQHMIMGGFMKDPKDNIRIDARAVNVETGEIEHTERVDDKADNIMTAVANLAGRLNTGIHLPAPARRPGDASPAPSPAPQQAGTPAAAPTATTKMPMRVAVLYGKALDAKDKGNGPAAVELFNAVLKEFPTYEPAIREKNSLTNK